MIGRRALLLLLLSGACARPASTPARAGTARPDAASRRPASDGQDAPGLARPRADQGAPARAPDAQRDGASAKEVARARALVNQGTKLYREGQYAQAEDVLKQAITLYPFMADANLALAKILLIRASATRDMTLYTNARLMLEMARALDPASREIEQLLELVRQPMAQ